MNKFMLAYICTFLLIVAGCFSGDPITQRVVVLDFPSSQGETNATLSLSDPQIQDAMRLIDEAFATNGFVRDKTPLASEDKAQGIVATYGAYDVIISGHKLIVNFVEFGKRKSSPIVVKTCSLLKDGLVNRYGAQNVSVQNDTSLIGVQ